MENTTVNEETYKPVYPLHLRPYGPVALNVRCTLCGELSSGATGWAWDALTGHFPAGGNGARVDILPPGDFCPFCAAALVAAGNATVEDI